MKVTILNTSIVTAHGQYTYESCSLEQAKELIAHGYQSAIGHESTASVISTLLGAEVKMNRMQFQQQPGETALVFKLKGRAPEGTILTTEEIEEIGYEWGLLERVDVNDTAPQRMMVTSSRKNKMKRLLPALMLLEKTIFATLGAAFYLVILSALWVAASSPHPGGPAIIISVVIASLICGLRLLIDRIHYSDCIKD